MLFWTFFFGEEVYISQLGCSACISFTLHWSQYYYLIIILETLLFRQKLCVVIRSSWSSWKSLKVQPAGGAVSFICWNKPHPHTRVHLENGWNNNTAAQQPANQHQLFSLPQKPSSLPVYPTLILLSQFNLCVCLTHAGKIKSTSPQNESLVLTVNIWLKVVRLKEININSLKWLGQLCVCVFLCEFERIVSPVTHSP